MLDIINAISLAFTFKHFLRHSFTIGNATQVFIEAEVINGNVWGIRYTYYSFNYNLR